MHMGTGSGKYKVLYGGWYQRTILHLDEIQEFFSSGTSELDLSEDDLKKYWRALKITDVRRESDYLDYVEASAEGGIRVRYYEDGLYSISVDSDDVVSARKVLHDYYSDRLNPAISYIFSLGAPTAHKLIQSRSHPTVVVREVSSLEDFEYPEEFGDEVRMVASHDAYIYKTQEGALVVVPEKKREVGERIAELHIFLSEFQYQLYTYLNLHRQVWENISEVKDMKTVKGSQVDTLRNRLEGYERIVNVVGNRIEQMDIFMGSRAAFVTSLGFVESLEKYLTFKFDSLTDTLTYIERVWKATGEHLASAIEGIVEIKNQSSAQGLRSLQLIASVGVLSTIIGYLTESELPQVTAKGAFYFIGIILVTWILNILINKIYLSRRYKVSKK